MEGRNEERITSVDPSKEESVRRVKDMASRGIDLLKVTSDEPGYVRTEKGMLLVGNDRVGRWVNTKKENLSMKEAMGYEVCKDPKIKTMSRKPGGVHQINELVFMTAPREIVEERKREQKGLGDARRKRSSAEFVETARRMGVETFEEGR